MATLGTEESGRYGKGEGKLISFDRPSLFCCDWPFLVSVNHDVLKTVLWIMIEGPSWNLNCQILDCLHVVNHQSKN